MKMKKEKIAILTLMYVAMVLVSLILNIYDVLVNENTLIDITKFNNLLVKSLITSLVILGVLVIFNYKKFIKEKSYVK
jgi:hypothetical protein